jgi:CheY-like chemotaxis protein
MTPERKKLFRYGVALDAVLIVTGIALNLPELSGSRMIAMFVAAVAIGAWRGGWGPALAALAFSFFSSLAFFHSLASSAALTALTGFGLVAAWAGSSVYGRTANLESIDSTEVTEPVFDREDHEPLPHDAPADAFQASQQPEASAPDDQGLEAPERAALQSESASDAVVPAIVPEESPAVAVNELPLQSSGDVEESPAVPSAVAVSASSDTEPAELPVAESQTPLAASEAEALPDLHIAASFLPAPDWSDEDEPKRLLEERLAANRALIEETLRQRIDRESEDDRLRLQRLGDERLAAERAEAERDFQQRLTVERASIQRRLADQLATERAAMEREAAARLAEERRVAQDSIERQFETERAALRVTAPGVVPIAKVPDGAAWMADELPGEAMQPDATSQTGSDLSGDSAAATQTPVPPFPGDSQTIMTSRGPIPKRPVSKTPARATPQGLFGSLWSGASGLFGRRSATYSGINLRARGPVAPPRVGGAVKDPFPADARRPRLLLIERRRAMADTVLPDLQARGVDAEVVERWIDAIDEMFRFRPDALLVDIEIPDYQRLLDSLTGPSSALPVFLTGRSRPSSAQLDQIPNRGFLTRPYDAGELARVAQQLAKRPLSSVRRGAVPLPTREEEEPALRLVPHTADEGIAEQRRPDGEMSVAAAMQLLAGAADDTAPAYARREPDADYIVECFNCGGIHDATRAEWCSCLTKERSLVCGNCLSCFCKAPQSYKEKFWLEAPSRLFERKTAELRHQQQAPKANPAPEYVARPLVLLVEDDEDIQVIVQRVTTKLGYGLVTASNGQEGLVQARLYKPDLILSDAFMPKLDGREMCRMLREESGFEQCRMVVMTGLYTDTKYKNEALRRFKVDEYIAKPVAITELIALLERHLEGSPVVVPAPLPAPLPVPVPEMRDFHPQEIINDLDEWPEESIALSDLMADSAQDAEEVGFEVLATIAPGVLLSELEPDPDVELAVESAAGPDSGHESSAAAVLEAGLAVDQQPDQTNYEICCFSCAETFDAAHAEWCSCLGRDQTLVCPECGNCFCKAPALYKERFWMDAPPILFERKTLGTRRSSLSRENPAPEEAKRPLILLVEDDENIQLIVRTVVTTLGYGFIVAADGLEGLALARAYKPDLILSDAFMPKLDGREMCRLLKADPTTAHARTIIMTGLYTDRKYRNEAFSHFKVDDYVAKPLAVDDLMRLLRKHLPTEVQQAI